MFRPLFIPLLVLVATPHTARSQSAPTNLDFEDGPVGGTPAGWRSWPSPFYRLRLVDSGAPHGRRAVLLEPTDPRFQPDNASMLQTIDATPFRGKVLRYSAWVRTALSDTSAWVGLVFSVNPSLQTEGSRRDPRDPLIRASDWREYQVVAPVSPDAATLDLGVQVVGGGRVWVDDIRLAVLGPAAEPRPTSPQAQAYLDSALALMHQHSIGRRHVNWNSLRDRAQVYAGGAQSVRETYPAIRYALRALGDWHSFLLNPDSAAARARTGAVFADTDAQLLRGRYAYIRIPSFSGEDPLRMASFAHAMQNAVAELDQRGACGWVVDLRTNRGGNMWPMLVGIGPVLGEGVAGAFISSDTSPSQWWYEAGTAGFGKTVQATTIGPPYRLRQSGVPVAVLLGGQTASSGEAIALSFRGRPNTRSFGTATLGLSTANEAYLLPDSAAIVLTTAYSADRTGAGRGGPVWPDQAVRGGATGEGDPVLDAAIQWLGSRAACTR
jgi:carboxyl-terminal processing protease